MDDSAFNPSDYGVHLTRRARGLPFWFALAVHGTDAFAEAVETTLALTRAGGGRDPGAATSSSWSSSPSCRCSCSAAAAGRAADYERWGANLRESGTAFVLPTTVGGETVGRLALVNPRTTIDDLRIVLDAMGG